MACSNPLISWRWPSVTHTARRTPPESQTRWVLVPKPPWERPSACPSGSAICSAFGPPSRGVWSGFFFRPGGGSAGAVDGGIDAPQVALDEAAPIQAEQQGVEDVGPGAVLAPAVEAVVDGLPGAVALRGGGPGGAGVQVPEDAVEKRAVVLPRAAGLAVVVALGEERRDPLPLGVSKIKAVHGGPPSGNRPPREMVSTFIVRRTPIVRNDLVRHSGEAIPFAACDSMLTLIREARDGGAWREVETPPQPICGNSFHRVFLGPGQYWEF